MRESTKGAVRFGRTDTPVVVVNGQLGALAIMRSLGPLGVPLYGVSNSRTDPARRSRYCRERFVMQFDEDRHEPYLQGLLDIGRRLGRRAILIATSDETTQFVADHADALREHFVFQENSPRLIRQLASKREMFELAMQHRVPTPDTRCPRHYEDVLAYARSGSFPVMLKGIYGNRLQQRTNTKMEIVHTPGQLLEMYRRLEDPQSPNLMIQELIPGADDQVFIFNGYFDRQSNCLAAFTGYKVRQYAIHVGCASLGECRWVDEVARTTIDFMKAIGYQGILDIGYRLDPRDRKYKVLDINPRVGQAFRLFVAENDHDVVKALYLDLTGQEQPPIVPREGRRWAIEDYDLISSLDYYREGTLRPMEWIKSYRRLEELAWFDWKDPAPLLELFRRYSAQATAWAAKRVKRRFARRAEAQPAVIT